MSDYDFVIRNGTIVDGNGSKRFIGDLAIKGDRIAALGDVPGKGREEIDAAGRVVTPGFVDIHTHYDGQATWEQRLVPSSGHGVTTVIAGNCGVGFAPCRAEDRDKLIKVMEGVEDIPEVVMTDGIPWAWETFPEYLEFLASRQFDVDIGAMIPHSALRVYVMGERGVNLEASTAADRKQMSQLVREAIAAGAVGVSTSRSLNHRAKDGKLAPSVISAESEVLALAEGLRAAGHGVFQLVTAQSSTPEEEAALIRKIAETARRPVSFTNNQDHNAPDRWRVMLSAIEDAQAAGLNVRGQVFCRAISVLEGLELSLNPIVTRPGYREIAHLPLEERVAILRQPYFKARILAESPVPDPHPVINQLVDAVENMVALGDPPNYTPTRDDRIGVRAAATGTTALSLAYDLMLEQDGKGVLMLPAVNYADWSMDVVEELLRHPHTVLGLGDGGAHYGLICDASYPSFFLDYWVRNPEPGQVFSLEWAVSELSRRPAETAGLVDRGVLAPGYKADINIIDLEKLNLYTPRVVRDLPAGGKRLRQKADGYDLTMVSGVPSYRDGASTGELPGRLLRASGYRKSLG
mgnify:CR=1 FL=1